MTVAMFIPYQQDTQPYILNDNYSKILDYAFENQPVFSLDLKQYSLILSYAMYSYEDMINKTATTLYRAFNNDHSYATLYGYALFLSKNDSLDEHIIQRVCHIHANL